MLIFLGESVQEGKFFMKIMFQIMLNEVLKSCKNNIFRADVKCFFQNQRLPTNRPTDHLPLTHRPTDHLPTDPTTSYRQFTLTLRMRTVF